PGQLLDRRLREPRARARDRGGDAVRTLRGHRGAPAAARSRAGDVTSRPAGPATPAHLLRELAPQVLGALVRHHGHFDAAEDGWQEALLAASVQWPKSGIPDNPRGWLITVGSRRLTDQLRSESARRRREDRDAVLSPPDAAVAPPPDDGGPAAHDDTLT